MSENISNSLEEILKMSADIASRGSFFTSSSDSILRSPEDQLYFVTPHDSNECKMCNEIEKSAAKKILNQENYYNDQLHNEVRHE
ncbi:MAG: hypothetical protein MHPSP_003520, partial [Paramarteilia canceri]